MHTLKFSVCTIYTLLGLLAHHHHHHHHLATAFSPSSSITQRPTTTTQPLHASIRPASPTPTLNRQKALLQIASSIPLLFPSTYILTPLTANAATKKPSNITPEAAVTSLKQSRDELSTASKKYLPKKDYNGLREYLSNPALNINQYETNASALLTSKALDNESKKEIGTIRRYGVGADVIIMYGGVLAEIDEENESDPDYKVVASGLKRTMDALDEIILICRSNGLGK